MVNKGFVSPIEQDFKRFRGLTSSLDSNLKSLNIFKTGILPLKFEDAHSPFLKSFSPAMKALTNYSRYFETFDMFKRQEQIWEELSPSFKFLKKNQQFFKTFDKIYQWNSKGIDSVSMSIVSSALGSIFNEENIRDIDFSGVDQLEPTGGSTINITLTDTITVEAIPPTVTTESPKKKLAEMTEEDLKRIIKGAITAAGGFSMAKFIVGLYSDYVADAAKILIEVVFAFTITICTGQYNDYVKSEIHNRIEQSMVVKDARKVITRYVKMNPTDQVAFLRKESFIRLGSSKTSPVAYFIKFPKNTVFTVVERRNTWIKVEVVGGEYDGERGWIEQSKLIKFKKIND